MNWQRQELVTQLFLAGKSRMDLGFPEKWHYDPLLRVWESEETYKSTHEGVTVRKPFLLSDKLVREMNWL